MDTLGQLGGIATAVVFVLGALFTAWYRYGRPRWHDTKRFFGRLDETINGREAEYDSYGRERAPAVPALADQQIAVLNRVSELTDVVRSLVQQHEEIETVKGRLDTVEKKADVNAQKIDRLEAAVMERIAGHIDSAAAFTAISDVAKKHKEEPK